MELGAIVYLTDRQGSYTNLYVVVGHKTCDSICINRDCCGRLLVLLGYDGTMFNGCCSRIFSEAQ